MYEEEAGYCEVQAFPSVAHFLSNAIQTRGPFKVPIDSSDFLCKLDE